MKISVVGGSLGGLTAAGLLRDSGHDVSVYERSATLLQQRGAGIGLLPPAFRYLQTRAGIDVKSISVSTSRIRYLDVSTTTSLNISGRSRSAISFMSEILLSPTKPGGMEKSRSSPFRSVISVCNSLPAA